MFTTRKSGIFMMLAALCLCASGPQAAAQTHTINNPAFATVLSFDATDGGNSEAGLIQATDGNFYGTTSTGGANSGGTVFRITPSGTLTTLHSFCAQVGCGDGDEPLAGLIQATDGNL